MQPVQFYNAQTHRKECLAPITPGHIKLYVCGITVYDYCHLGHARMFTCFDLLVRALRAMGYQVTYVQNITDIDDKIIHRAAERQESIQALTARFIDALHEDARSLAVLPPDHEPRATEYIPEMIALIEQLIAKGFAYVGDNQDVYYAVNKFSAYGQLSGQTLEHLRAGARIASSESKQDPLDFVLWKSAKPGEPSWPSPWGLGRPGWHTECCVMSCALLGDHFDLHGGGMDLLFPHHENEVAQSVAAYDCKFANMWLHNGFVQIDQEKMSKSVGNFFTIREVLKKCDPETLRYFLIAPHYRSPVNYSDESLGSAKKSLDRIYGALQDIDRSVAQKPSEEPYSAAFFAALADDLNVPEALAVIFDLVRTINRLKLTDLAQAASLACLLVELLAVLGIGQKNPTDYFHEVQDDALSKETKDERYINDLIQQREAARQAKDWQRADEVRKQLVDYGILIEDTAQGTRWRVSEDGGQKTESE